MEQGPNPGGGPAGTPAQPLGVQEEQTWSILAHLSVLVMPFGALVIWLIFKDRSEKVRFHSLQALWYQLAWIAIFIAFFFISFILSFVLIGFFMFFLLPVLPFVPVVHGCYAAYQVSQGVEYRYPLVADWIEGPLDVV